MTKNSNQSPEKNPVPATGQVLNSIIRAARNSPQRMPAGGWFRDVATSENWRTTTIVRRHRDRAMMTPAP